MRRTAWLAKILVAALAGVAWRLVRLLLRRPPRIWHGFTPLHATAWMVRAEREEGFPSVSVVLHTRASRYALVRSEDFDRVLEAESERWDDAHWLALRHLLLHGDIWNAYFDCLLFGHQEERKNELAFRLLRAVGVRIVVQPHGSDLLCTGRYESEYGWPELAQLDYPTWDLEAQREIVDRRVRLFTRYADVVAAGDALYEGVIGRYEVSFHTVPVDVDTLRPSKSFVPGAVPVVIHAPNHRNVKGTQKLLDALEVLRERGFAYELRLIEGVPRHEALRLYEAADLIADQFMMGAFGIFALEGMCLGKPVMTYLDEAHQTRPEYGHPLVNTRPESLIEVLAVLLAVPELRLRIGEASRESVVRYQSFPVLADVWRRIYEHVWWRRPLVLADSPVFSPARVRGPWNPDPSSPDFWPVPVDDLLPDIRQALERVTRNA